MENTAPLKERGWIGLLIFSEASVYLYLAKDSWREWRVLELIFSGMWRGEGMIEMMLLTSHEVLKYVMCYYMYRKSSKSYFT